VIDNPDPRRRSSPELRPPARPASLSLSHNNRLHTEPHRPYQIHLIGLTPRSWRGGQALAERTRAAADATPVLLPATAKAQAPLPTDVPVPLCALPRPGARSTSSRRRGLRGSGSTRPVFKEGNDAAGDSYRPDSLGGAWRALHAATGTGSGSGSGSDECEGDGGEKRVSLVRAMWVAQESVCELRRAR
jgi:hypothetical protein